VIILTNTVSQELAPGQSLTFNLRVLHTGKCECFREGSGAVVLGQRNAIYDVDFSANIGATVAAGVAQLAIASNGSPLVETTMISTTAAVGDLNNVAKHTAIKTCCCGPESITIINTGETTVVVENPSLFIRRLAYRE